MNYATTKPSSVMRSPSLFGGISIVACVCVGAGMLGLPSAGAGAWTTGTLFILIVAMLAMTASGCLLLEIFKSYPLKSSFSSVTKDLLGKKANIFNNLMVYFVGGVLLYAYTTSSGLLIEQYTGIPPKLASIGFVCVFSLFVWHSTKWVDRLSVVLILFMILSFIFVISGLMNNIQASRLLGDIEWQQTHYVWPLVPIALASFGYHHTVSTLRDYYIDEKRVQKVIVLGTSLALIIYTIWILSIYGNLPREQFASVIAQGGNIDALLQELRASLPNNNILSEILAAFSVAAILSSFVGVGFGLFDFLADFFQLEDTPKGRLKTWGITFIPPLVFSLAMPFGFLAAIGFAASASAIWTCIIPPLLVRKLRLDSAPPAFPNIITWQPSNYRVKGGNSVLVGVFLFGLSVILINLLVTFDLIPVFQG